MVRTMVIRTALLSAVLLCVCFPSYSLPIFPGAQGFASDITGGRGGKIIRVTNLKDAGSGSFHDAVSQSGKRIVVFEVGGVVKTGKNISIKNGDLTIAGETAPYPGFTLCGPELNINGKNILIRHIAIRVGREYCIPEKGSEKDAVNMFNGAQNVYLDHLSCCWANDETMSLQTNGNCSNVTWHNCIIAEGMLRGNHWKGAHNMGSVIGKTNKKLSIIGCLYSTLGARNPLIRGGASCVMVNSLIYNCKNFGTTCEEAGANVVASLVGNVYKAGPACALRTSGHPDHKLGWINYATGGGSKIYFKDCRSIPYNGKDYMVSAPPSNSAVSEPGQTIWSNTITVKPSSEVHDRVVANVGMRPADREKVDQRLIDNVVNQKGNLIQNETDPQIGGYPHYEMTRHTLDIPSDPNGDDDNDGYTNVEEWLHEKAAAISTGPVSVIKNSKTSHRVSVVHPPAAERNLRCIWKGHKTTLQNARTSYYSLTGSLISRPSRYSSGVLIETYQSSERPR